MGRFERIPAERLAAVGALATSAISDALDSFGLAGAGNRLRPLRPGSRAVGQAVTARFLPIGLRGTSSDGNLIGLTEAGDVLVIDNYGRTDCTVWGSILTEVAYRRGVAGTVIHGVNRDANESRDFDYPIFSLGLNTVTGKGRVTADGVNVPVSLGTVRDEPGDVIVGDDSGVVVIPLERFDQVAEKAQSVALAEQRILEEVRAGSDLQRSRIRHGYATLQSRIDR